MSASDLHIRAAGSGDAAWVAAHLERTWGATTIMSRGVAHDAARLPALLAEHGGVVVGCATVHTTGGETELVTLDALRPGMGIGGALLSAVADLARGAGSRRLWLVTTNDNLDALRFYQRRRLRIVGVHPGAVDAARSRKPSIPRIGSDGIPLHDELELELVL